MDRNVEHRKAIRKPLSRLFTEAWIETYSGTLSGVVAGGRLFTEAWIETDSPGTTPTTSWSPLHGGVDRNVRTSNIVPQITQSPLHGGVDRNHDHVIVGRTITRRLFTEAWIETAETGSEFMVRNCRLFTEAWIETANCRNQPSPSGASPLHGGVDRNGNAAPYEIIHAMSPLHGGVDRNCTSETFSGSR